MNDSSSTLGATLIVVASGRLQKRVARLATERASFEPKGRRVLTPGDALYPPPTMMASWTGRDVAAVVVNGSGRICALLDSRQALVAGWIEDAFLRAKRVSEHQFARD